MTENKCEKAGFQHAWENSTPNIVYPTNPPRYPAQEETCKNCGLIRYHREKIEKWVEYSDGQAHDDYFCIPTATLNSLGKDIIAGGIYNGTINKF